MRTRVPPTALCLHTRTTKSLLLCLHPPSDPSLSGLPRQGNGAESGYTSMNHLVDRGLTPDQFPTDPSHTVLSVQRVCDRTPGALIVPFATDGSHTELPLVGLGREAYWQTRDEPPQTWSGLVAETEPPSFTSSGTVRIRFFMGQHTLVVSQEHVVNVCDDHSDEMSRKLGLGLRPQ